LIEDAGRSVLGSKPGNKTTVIKYGTSLFVRHWKPTTGFTQTNTPQLSELLHADPRFADSPALANERIWNNNLRTTPAHGRRLF